MSARIMITIIKYKFLVDEELLKRGEEKNSQIEIVSRLLILNMILYYN